jgi:hypothetical protein
VSPAAPVPIRRILLMLDADGEQLDALESVARLALALDAELEALFVEDADLLRLAALPFAREMGMASAQRRPLRNDDMERALRAQATRAQIAVASVTVPVRVRWSFRVTRGQVVAQVTEAALTADLITLALGGEPAQRLRSRAVVRGMLASTARPLLVLPAGSRLQAPILVIYDGSAAGQRALQLAQQLLGRPQDALQLVFVPHSRKLEALRAMAETQLGESAAASRYRVLESCTPAALARLVRAAAAGTLLLPLQAELMAPEQVGVLLERIHCAVLLVP